MKKIIMWCLLIILIVGNIPIEQAYADTLTVNNVTFEIDYELTSSDDTYNYYTMRVDFSNPKGCHFGLSKMQYCSIPNCSCSANILQDSCTRTPTGVVLSDSDFVYESSSINAVSGFCIYEVKVLKTEPVYRIVYVAYFQNDDYTVTSVYNLIGDKKLTPSVTPKPTNTPTPEPTKQPSNSVFEDTDFDFDYELTSSDDTYNYYTVYVNFSNPNGCNFGLSNMSYCSHPSCSCSTNTLQESCNRVPADVHLDNYSPDYDFSVSDDAVSASCVYTVKVLKTEPVYRFVYTMYSQDGDSKIYYNLVGDKVLTPTDTPDITDTPSPTSTPEVTGTPNPTEAPEITPVPAPIVSVDIGVVYKGDEFIVTVEGNVDSVFDGTSVLEIWSDGATEKCVSSVEFTTGSSEVSFTADRYSPYTAFYGKITFTYNDTADSDTPTVINKITNSVTIEFDDYIPSGKAIGNLKDLLYYIWDYVLELSISFEGFDISFKALFLFTFFAYIVILFIKRLLGREV